MKFTGRILMILMACTLLLHATESAAQQFSLSGTVRDVDGLVPEATVTLIGGGAEPRTTATDNMGNYSFSGLAPGYYELSFAKAGYDNVTRNLTLGPNSGPVHMSCSMPASPPRGSSAMAS